MIEKFDVMNVFDNEGYSIDRYTVWLLNEAGDSYLVVSSENPSHPQGVWSVSENESIDIDSLNDEEEDNKHIGKEIEWDSLPLKVKTAIENYFPLQ